MIHLEVGGKRYPVAAGETVIGSAPGSAIILEGEGIRPRHAVVQGTAAGAAAIRSADPEGDLLINGVRLGTDPTPVLHGDKIQIGGQELLAVDPSRVGHTKLYDSGAFADLAPPPPIAKPARGATGGRLVCLTDGREYTVESEPLVFGREAGADVVVSGSDVSRHHAEIQTTEDGYVLVDLSVNGTHVNGQRIGRSHPLARADVIRIGSDEFRFYSAALSAQPPKAAGSTPSSPMTAPQESTPPAGAGQRLSDTLHGLPALAPLASLLVRSGTLKGERLPVRVAAVSIGSAEHNDIVIAEPSVSPKHAKLQRRETVWVLTDLNSANGTFVDGEPVTVESPLSPGSTLRFGDVAVLFEPLDDGVAPEPPAESRAARRTPIHAATPRPSGPPAWLIALLVILVAVVVYFLMSRS
ncbi:MAG: FHA domain-containing protein [Gemmatimonadota bacterium]|nr:FHA domain-containing protein [Gemmatimonadota bacterium]